MSERFQKKSASTSQEIPVAALPDIIFMLLIFFMVTTVFRETEVEVRTILPSAEALTKIEQKRLVSYLYIGPRKEGGGEFGETAIQVDDAVVENVSNLREIFYTKVNEEPRLIVSLKVDEESEMGIVNEAQQELRQANALRINYSSTEEGGPDGEL